MDREADSYAILAALEQSGSSFVIQSFQDRVLANEEGRLREAARAARRSFDRDVPLSRRPAIKGPKGERHPARRERIARLSFAAAAIEIPRTSKAKAAPTSTLKLNVIYVTDLSISTRQGDHGRKEARDSSCSRRDERAVCKEMAARTAVFGGQGADRSPWTMRSAPS
jgi:hypothetical protein